MLIHHNLTKGTQMVQMKKNICKENVILYSKEAIILNNCLRSTESATYCLPRLVDGKDGDGNIIDEEIEWIATYPVVCSLWHLIESTCLSCSYKYA